MDNIVFVCPTLAVPGVDWLVKAAWLPFVPQLHVVNYPLWGLDGLEANYAHAELQILALYARLGKLRLVGWSQGGVNALRFALDHPGLVERLVLIAAPFKGSWVAEFFPWVPAARDMCPDSASCQLLESELRDKAMSLPPTVVLVAVEDGVIHEDAAKLPGVYDEGFPIQYHVFSNLPLMQQMDTSQIHWHWAPGAFHLTMGFHPIVLRYLRAALSGPIGLVIPPPPDPEAMPFPA